MLAWNKQHFPCEDSLDSSLRYASLRMTALWNAGSRADGEENGSPRCEHFACERATIEDSSRLLFFALKPLGINCLP